jgi:hypothetical protein
MHRYETSTPRVALGIAAVAMTAITVAILVVIPARIEAISHEPVSTLAMSQVTTLASTSAVTGATIDVVAVHGPGLATASCTVQSERRAGRLSKTMFAAIDRRTGSCAKTSPHPRH